MTRIQSYWRGTRLGLIICATVFAMASCIVDFDQFQYVSQLNTSGGGSSAGGAPTTTNTGGRGNTVNSCQSPADCSGTDTDCQSRICINNLCNVAMVKTGTTCDEAGGTVCNGKGKCISCGVAKTAPGSNQCPAVCNGGCTNNECLINCQGKLSCENDTIFCPANYDCKVVCDGERACRRATIDCPATYACSATCSGIQGCAGLNLDCTDGQCNLSCGVGINACTTATLACGDDSCEASCAPMTSQPIVNCGNACACTSC